MIDNLIYGELYSNAKKIVVTETEYLELFPKEVNCMGADIHSCLQVQQADGAWETVAVDVFPFRSYDIFGCLAGVRGMCEEPIQENRGFPSDFPVDEGAEEYHNGYWMGEHSFGWVTAAELKAFDWAKHRDNEPDVPVHVLAVIKLAEEKLGGLDKVRVVFGFDS